MEFYKITINFSGNSYYFYLDYRDCDYYHGNSFYNSIDFYFYFSKTDKKWILTNNGYSTNHGDFTSTTCEIWNQDLLKTPSGYQNTSCFKVGVTGRNILENDDYGYLHINDTLIQSGETILLEVYSIYEFSTYTGLVETSYKFRDWNEEIYINPANLYIDFNDIISAHFYNTFPLTVNNNLEGGSGGDYKVVWDKLPYGQATLNSGDSFNAFEFNLNRYDEYNIIAGSTIEDINGTDWKFYYWDDDIFDANHEKSNVQVTGPISFTANYKGHFRSNSVSTFNSSSQRKLVRTGNGIYHTVYESYDRLWYTYSQSSNFNGGWVMEELFPGSADNDFNIKNPSMDYHENNLAVVFESADEDDSYIILILYDPASGVYTRFEAAETEVEYFGSARPVVAYTKREIMVIWKESSGSALKYRKLFKDDLGNWDWVDDEEDLPNSDSYSTNPTIAAVKSDSETKFYIHIAWQYSSSSIKYMEYSHENGVIQFTPVSVISSGSGFTQNKYPCISLYSNAYPAPYPIVSWTGVKKEYIEDGPLAKTGGQCGGYVWVYRTVVRPKAGGWGSFYQTGSNVGYTNNNSTTNSSPYETIIAFSQSNGQTTKWIKRENSSYSVQTLSDNGIQTQVSNGGGLSEVKAVVFNKDDLPYVCTPSNTDFSGGLSKASAHLPVTYGRVGVVVKNNIEFVYNIGDIQLDDENILFIERDDTLAVNNLKELNDAVRTENFDLNSNCKLQFSNIYYVVNSESADSLLDKNDAVTFKVELVNADNDRVAALFDQITYNKKNTDKYENIDYQLDCAGIQSGKYYIRLVTAVKGKRDCFLSNVQNDISHLAKKNYKQVDLEKMIIPFKYELSQNYPNPFNPVTTIRYEMPEKGQVTLKVYDILGREAAVLVNKIQSKGSYKVEFNGQHLSSGIYLYSLKINNFTAKKKMLLVK